MVSFLFVLYSFFQSLCCTYIGFIFAKSLERMRSFSETSVEVEINSFCRSRSILADNSLFISMWLCSTSRWTPVWTVSYFRSSSAKLNISLNSYSFNYKWQDKSQRHKGMRKETSTTRRNRKGNGNVVENICKNNNNNRQSSC